MRHDKQHNALEFADCAPALLPGFVDPVLHQHQIRVVEDFGGRFKADLVFGLVDLSLRRVPFEFGAGTLQQASITPTTNPFPTRIAAFGLSL